MISRRGFVKAGGVVVGAAAAVRPLLAARREGKVDGASLPESIAGLKSRKGEAVAVTREEREGRQERARRLMSENGLGRDGADGRHIAEILHWHWMVGRRAAVCAGAAGEGSGVLCVARRLRKGRAREQIANAPGRRAAGCSHLAGG